MPYEINDTHDPNLKSWVESANDAAADFPIQNLPMCVFQVRGEDEDAMHPGVLIGDGVLDLDVAIRRGLLADDEGPFDELFDLPGLSMLFELTPDEASSLRACISRLLRADSKSVRDKALQRTLVKRQQDVVFLPTHLALNYTDFYASIHHATTVGSMFRPDNPLLPNYKHVPIGYHGRASSIIVSGAEVNRPRGQQAPPDDNPGAGPSFGPCKLLDYELELGFIVCQGNQLGQPISIAEAEDHLFGVCLVNDWSARDMQKWEYQPLGPFLAKNFATSVSPCIVTMEALAPFRCTAYQRSAGDPRPLPYLMDERDQQQGGLDITLEVYLASKQMRDRGLAPVRLSRGNTKDLYWTPAQMLAHHTSGGCNMLPGDLFASGTVSGSSPDSRGCLLELTWDGPGKPRKPIQLPTGETRVFLQDGDEVILKGCCERDGFRRIGLGECRGIIAPAVG